MENNKRQIQKLESKSERKTTYRKRSKGVLKKAFELSVLCDINLGLIMFSPEGKLRHFSTRPRIEKILKQLVQSIPNMPEEDRKDLQISQDIIDRINRAAGPDDAADQQGSDALEREEINRGIIDLQNKLKLLQELEKTLDPAMGTLNSVQKLEEHMIRCCENALTVITNRKEQLMSRQSSGIPFTSLSLSLQSAHLQQIPMQQPQPQGREQVQQPGVPPQE